MSSFSEDLKRYHRRRFEWYEPSLYVVAWFRFGQWIRRLPAIPAFLLNLVHLPVYMVLTLLTGIHLPRGCRIGPGLRIYHFGGIVLNSEVVIGSNCTLRHNVTVGNRRDEHDVPVIGDGVDVGVGAVILGAIRIGNNVKIGANAVVICDVPDGHTAVGNPARCIPPAQNESANRT